METNGASPGGAPVLMTNLNFGGSDVANIVTIAHPIIVGNRSFQKFYRMHLDNIGTSNNVSLFKHWKDSGAYKTGEGISSSANTFYRANGAAILETYHTPSAGVYVFQSGLSTGNPTIDLATVITLAGSVDIGGGLGGTLSAPDTFSDYIVSQMFTSALTPAGAVNQKVMGFQYTES